MATIPNNSLSGPLAPKFNIHEDTRNASNRPELPKQRSRTNYVPFGIFIVFSLLAIPLTLAQVRNQQDFRQQAAAPFPTQIIPSPTPFLSETSGIHSTPEATMTPPFPTATPRIE